MPQWHDVNPKSDRPSGQALGSALPLFHLKRRSAGTARLPNRADGRPTSLVWVGHDDPDHTCPLSVINGKVYLGGGGQGDGAGPTRTSFSNAASQLGSLWLYAGLALPPGV